MNAMVCNLFHNVFWFIDLWRTCFVYLLPSSLVSFSWTEIYLWPQSCQQGCIGQAQEKCFSLAKESKYQYLPFSGIRGTSASPCLNSKILINQIYFRSSLVYSSWTSSARYCALSAPFQHPLPNPAASAYHLLVIYLTSSCSPGSISCSSFSCSSPSADLLKLPAAKPSWAAASSTSYSSMPKPDPYHSSRRSSGC